MIVLIVSKQSENDSSEQLWDDQNSVVGLYTRRYIVKNDWIIDK